jgi:hypothetical protein
LFIWKGQDMGFKVHRDWRAYKVKFISSNLSLNEFCKREKLPWRTTYNVYREKNWEAARQELLAKAELRLHERLSEKLAKDLEHYYETFHAIHSKIRQLLQKPDMKAYELKDLVQSLDLAVKNQLLITGRATAKVGLDHETTDRLRSDPAQLASAIASELQAIKELESLETGAGGAETTD